MLNQIRSQAAGIGAKLLLALLVLSFAVWGIGDMAGQSGRGGAVATVGKERISVAAYQNAVRRETENLRRAFGDKYSPELLKSLNLEVQALNPMINQSLLEQEGRALKLIPSDADIVRRIRSNANYHDSKGAFDRKLFDAMLKNAGLSEKTYVEQLRREIAAGILMDTISGNYRPLDIAITTVRETREEQRGITLYTLKPSLVSNMLEPDKATLEAYYAEHAREFSAPEARTASYVTLKNGDLPDKVQVPEAELRKAYNEHLEEFRRPERRDLEQLLYSSEDNANKAYDLLRSGKTVAQAAKLIGVINKDSLSMDKVERGQLIEAAEELVFSLKAGEYTEPLKSPFGWHIFRVKKIIAPSVTPFEEARVVLEKDLAQKLADEALGKLANTLEDSLAAGSSLQEAAKELGLKVHTVGPVTMEGKTPEGTLSKAIPELDKFLDTVFKTDEKTESSLITSRGGVSYIVRVDSVTPERTRELSEVRAAVVAAWQMEHRGEQLAKLSEEIAKKMADPATRGEAIAKYNLSPSYNGAIKRSSRSAGDTQLPPVLVAELFAAKKGGGTRAYMLKSGDYALAIAGAVVPAAATDKSKADKAALEEIERELRTSMRNELVEQYLNALGRKYSVSIDHELIKAAAE